MARRLLSTTAVQSEGKVHPVFHKLKATQQAYQQDNGLVVSILGMRKPLIYYVFGVDICNWKNASMYLFIKWEILINFGHLNRIEFSKIWLDIRQGENLFGVNFKLKNGTSLLFFFFFTIFTPTFQLEIFKFLLIFSVCIFACCCK